MKKFCILFLFTCVSCISSPTAQDIVDAAIKASGAKKLKNATASFTFRGTDYAYQFRNGSYRYIRTQIDSLGNEIQDVLVNTSLSRFVNGNLVQLDQEKETAYRASVNSVIYFAFLPLWLNDAAVNKAYIDQVDIKGKTYYKVKVTFDADGGGEDYEDIFYYWFDTEDYSMDYLAYSYNEDDGKGIRFREAYHTRKIKGVIIQDYLNYKPVDENKFSLEIIDQAFIANELELLSVIELENVKVNI
ncbi:MAG: DUF6503 family protein [Bacteroidota bacterium]